MEEDGWLHTASLIFLGQILGVTNLQKCKRTLMSFKKEDITPTPGSNEGSALFDKGKSLNSNNSNGECNSSDGDFRRLNYQ
jgi:hypothetical protein